MVSERKFIGLIHDTYAAVMENHKRGYVHFFTHTFSMVTENKESEW